MNKAQRRALAALVRDKYRNIYCEIDGRRRLIRLAYSNEKHVEDATGRRVRLKPETAFLFRDTSAFRWTLDGDSGISVMTWPLIQKALAGSSVADKIIRDTIKENIEQRRGRK